MVVKDLPCKKPQAKTVLQVNVYSSSHEHFVPQQDVEKTENSERSSSSFYGAS